jgi:hypothetical protein
MADYAFECGAFSNKLYFADLVHISSDMPKYLASHCIAKSYFRGNAAAFGILPCVTYNYFIIGEAAAR